MLSDKSTLATKIDALKKKNVSIETWKFKREILTNLRQGKAKYKPVFEQKYGFLRLKEEKI